MSAGDKRSGGLRPCVFGGKAAAPVIGSVLLNVAVFGAMLSYILRAISFIVLPVLEPARS